MVKAVVILFCIFSFLYADVYQNNCVKCHKKIEVSIDKYFYRYLLKYSSEKEVKKAIKRYLQAPKKENSVMPESFLARFGVKKPTTLSPQELDKAINTYWQKYKVFGKLK